LHRSREGAFTVLGGSILIGQGFIGLATSTNLSNLTQLATGDYLRLWTFTILLILCGFVVLVAGFLLASEGNWRVFGGGFLGVLGSVVGALACLGLILDIVGLGSNASNFGSNPQFSVSYELLLIGTIPAMLLGFPLGMYGSAAGLMGHEEKRSTSADTGLSSE
jgi:hypothetical protein